MRLTHRDTARSLRVAATVVAVMTISACGSTYVDDELLAESVAATSTTTAPPADTATSTPASTVAGDVAAAVTELRSLLDALSDAERARFEALNAAYTARFGFPFIIAVRAHSKAQILAAFERRLAQTAEAEFAEACRQVEHIALFRLQEMLHP